jgi:hypothetical protein
MFKNNLTNFSNPNIPNKKLNFTEITKSILFINFVRRMEKWFIFTLCHFHVYVFSRLNIFRCLYHKTFWLVDKCWWKKKCIISVEHIKSFTRYIFWNEDSLTILGVSFFFYVAQARVIFVNCNARSDSGSEF